jgi:3-oxoadipate enol-lactonase
MLIYSAPGKLLRIHQPRGTTNMPHQSANGIQLYYQQAGSGERLLFISGTGGDLRVKPNVFDSPLAAQFELLSYDQRGLGQSDKPQHSYSMADYADDAAALLDALGWSAVPVMGVSFGGMVAQELALRHPDRVRALVLACTSSGGEGGASYPLHELEDLPEQERLVRHLEISDLRRDAAWRTANPERWQTLLAMASAAGRKDAQQPEDAAGARRQLQARAGHDTFARLPQLKVPVLLAGGEFDGIAPKRNMIALAEQIPGARLEFFAGGHLFLIQDKAAYPFIIQWLKEN